MANSLRRSGFARLSSFFAEQLSLFAPTKKRRVKHTTHLNASKTLLLSSSPELHLRWVELRKQWFPERTDLDQYRVSWSRRRQKNTLATCFVQEKRVSVARELNYPAHYKWLDPLLYHEMCHAVLGMRVSHCGTRAWHDREFRTIERRHPGIGQLDLWIKNGGWQTAVRSDRAKRAAYKRGERILPLKAA